MSERKIGVMYACRACTAGNGHEAMHCHKCGASLRDAVPIKGAGEFGNAEGEAFHRELVRQHRKHSLGMVLAWICPLEALLAFLAGFPWISTLGHALWGAVVITLVARYRLGHLRAIFLGSLGTMLLCFFGHPVMLQGLVLLPLHSYIYAFAGSSVRSTNDLTG